jgi:uroporphyrin-III C-methyltransferase / precorrin-2 dehydrogenase / sirohydrochlorin ferrochelatase
MSRHPALPISLYVRDRKVVVVGAGSQVEPRRARLQAAGARVVSVGPEAWEPALCRDALAVLALTDDRPFDRRVAGEARAAGCLAYAHDQPAVSDFAMPALVARGPLKLAISTDGVAPALARRLREELERVIGAAGERIDALLAELERRRADLAQGRDRLYQVASRLRLEGRVTVGDPDPE